MRRLLLVLLGTCLFLPGGVVAALGYPFWKLYSAGRTGYPKMDRFAMRGAIAFWVLLVFRSQADVPTMRSLMAILHNESGGKPENFLGDNTGDVAPAGPSVGPLQVYRRTARGYGLVVDSITQEAYAKLAQQPFRAIGLGVRTYKHKLAEAGGDHSEARRRYNGRGPMAEAYAARADDFENRVFGLLG